jgi:hypothetical protein
MIFSSISLDTKLRQLSSDTGGAVLSSFLERPRRADTLFDSCIVHMDLLMMKFIGFPQGVSE